MFKSIFTWKKTKTKRDGGMQHVSIATVIASTEKLVMIKDFVSPSNLFKVEKGTKSQGLAHDDEFWGALFPS